MSNRVVAGFGAFSMLVTSSASLAVEWNGAGVTDFVNADISGWQLQCDLKIREYEDPSKCLALFALDDGNVILDYREDGLRIQTIGKCGIGIKPPAPLHSPTVNVAKEIEATARRADHKCKPPVLTAQLFLGLKEVNTIATILAQKRP